MKRQCPRCKASVPDWRLDCPECGHRFDRPVDVAACVKQAEALEIGEVVKRRIREQDIADVDYQRRFWATSMPAGMGMIAMAVGVIVMFVSVPECAEGDRSDGIMVALGGFGLIWAGALSIAVGRGVACLFDICSTLKSDESVGGEELDDDELASDLTDQLTG